MSFRVVPYDPHHDGIPSVWNGPLMQEIVDAIGEAQSQYHRLVLPTGGHGATRTKLLRGLAAVQGWPYVQLSPEISRRMLGLTTRQRASQVGGLVKQLVEEAGAPTVLLDHIEVLYAPVLQVDPLRALQGACRSTVVVAAWPGTYDGVTLTYAKAGHPERRVYRG